MKVNYKGPVLILILFCGPFALAIITPIAIGIADPESDPAFTKFRSIFSVFFIFICLPLEIVGIASIYLLDSTLEPRIDCRHELFKGTKF